MNQLVTFTDRTHSLSTAASPRAQTRFFEFFVCTIRNPHTRRAYDRAAPNAYVLASCPIGPSRANNKDCYF